MPPASDPVESIRAYHRRTKHHLSRYAAGPDGLDWANQPDPFRTFTGDIPHRIVAAGRRSGDDLRRAVRPRYDSCATSGPDEHRGAVRIVAGTVGVEGVSRLALGATLQPLQRQPAPHRGLPRAADAPGAGNRHLSLREPGACSGTALLPRAPGHRSTGQVPAAELLSHGPELSSLARELEVWGQGLSVCPA